nr:CHAT domain-containing protein [Parafrankia sp. EUN1f]
MSSYTPNIRTLLYARRPGGSGTAAGSRMAVVAMPNTPGEQRLDGVEQEAAMIRDRFRGGVEVLSGPTATHDSVVAALRSRPWVHFACHGVSNPTAPSTSHLLLHDDRLTVADIAALRLETAEFAFLSACSTSRPTTALTDETIHLASAFQLAGYRRVIATLWPIEDRSSAHISDAVYGFLADGGTDATADALHAAVRRLRAAHPAKPSIWAAHIHVGA